MECPNYGGANIIEYPHCGGVLENKFDSIVEINVLLFSFIWQLQKNMPHVDASSYHTIFSYHLPKKAASGDNSRVT